MTISAFSDELAQVGVRMPYSVINQAGKSSTRSIAVLRRWRSWAKAGSTQQRKRNARNPQSKQKESMYSVLYEAAALPKNTIPRAWKNKPNSISCLHWQIGSRLPAPVRRLGSGALSGKDKGLSTDYCLKTTEILNLAPYAVSPFAP